MLALIFNKVLTLFNANWKVDLKKSNETYGKQLHIVKLQKLKPKST